MFNNLNDPRRLRFDPLLDYNRNDETLKFNDKNVQRLFRNQQLANQMHECCFSCWKYDRVCKVCRFNFPYVEDICDKDVTTIKIDKDKRNRKRVRALPPRNNAHINNGYVDPLITLAHNGNVDVQYIDNSYGACEYAASYSSKADEPDEKQLVKMFVRKLVQKLKYGSNSTIKSSSDDTNNDVDTRNNISSIMDPDLNCYITYYLL